MEFNNPLMARTVAAHAGSLPAKWGLIQLSGSGDDVVTSALKSSADGSVVWRVYEAAGIPSKAKASWSGTLTQVHEANLIEDAGVSVDVQHDSFEFDLRPYEIKTFKLAVKPLR